MQITSSAPAASQAETLRSPRPAPQPFEPLELKQTAKSAAEAQEPAAPAAYVRPGTHIDIKV